VILTTLEIKGAVVGVITSVLVLIATFTAGGIYRDAAKERRNLVTSCSTLQTWHLKGELFSSKAVLTAMVKTRMEARTRRAF
jgi:hypothetical protein